MEFIYFYIRKHLEEGLILYFMLLMVFTWNYVLLPETIPFYLFNFIDPTGSKSLFILVLLNILFVFLLSLLFIHPNKEVVKEYRFKHNKHKTIMFWICQFISFSIVIFIRQFYEVMALIISYI